MLFKSEYVSGAAYRLWGRYALPPVRFRFPPFFTGFCQSQELEQNGFRASFLDRNEVLTG